ncbi:CHMP6-like protein [Mya arenaria]|uniref:CHMP6-like protein n=1 Tax=Mya arenaria TaxID=6604 RepID=A0ABY7DJQ2_MYAAR|nr:CHMP6-like protein [Mya arenaria]
MGNLFGKKDQKKPASRVTEQDKAVLIEKDRESARQFLKNGKKEKAKLLLRKKKFGETQIEKMDGQLENLDRMVHDLEFAQIEAEVVKGLQRGNESLKQLNKMFSIETVEKIMDETREAAEYQEEIEALLSGGLSQQDEDDVLSELDDIIKSSLPDVEREGEPELPDVPSGEPAGREHPRKERRQEEAMLASGVVHWQGPWESGPSGTLTHDILEGESPAEDGPIFAHTGDVLLLWADLDTDDGGAVASPYCYHRPFFRHVYISTSNRSLAYLQKLIISTSYKVVAIWGEVHSIDCASLRALQFSDRRAIKAFPVPDLACCMHNSLQVPDYAGSICTGRHTLLVIITDLDGRDGALVFLQCLQQRDKPPYLSLSSARHDVEVPLPTRAHGVVLCAGKGCHPLVVGSCDRFSQHKV